MDLFGLTITRRKALSVPGPALHAITGSSPRSWFTTWIDEITTGGWQRNECVRASTVLANSVLYACITLIASDIAKLRLKLVEQDPESGIWSETESAAFSPVLRKPNHYQTRIDFVRWWMVSKLCHGNTYALKERDERGVVVALYILDPCRIRPLVAPDGSVFYALYADEFAANPEATVPAREIIHDVCCPLFHPLCGVSPIYAAGAAALRGLTIQESSSIAFENTTRPGGVLLVPGTISNERAAELKTQFIASQTGDNRGSVAVLTGGMTFQYPNAVSAADSQLVEQLGLTYEDIARCFHMPRHKVGIGPDPSFNNIEALNQQYYADCLQEHIESFELKLDEGIGLTAVPNRILGTECERDDLFQMDSATRVTVAKDALSAGASPNEARRRWLDLGPVRGGETPYLQEQNWPLELLAARTLPSDRPPTPPAPMPAIPETTPPAAKSFSLADWAHVRDRYNRKMAA